MRPTRSAKRNHTLVHVRSREELLSEEIVLLKKRATFLEVENAKLMDEKAEGVRFFVKRLGNAVHKKLRKHTSATRQELSLHLPAATCTGSCFFNFLFLCFRTRFNFPFFLFDS
jgi:hypothetical protein